MGNASTSTVEENAGTTTEVECENTSYDDNTPDQSTNIVGTAAASKFSISSLFSGSDEWNSQFLLGNLDKFPDSARKLLSMGKLYLKNKTECSVDSRRLEELNLFQPLYLPPSANRNHRSEGSDVERVDNERTSPVYGSRNSSNMFVPLNRATYSVNCAQTYIQWRAAHDVMNMYAFCMPTRNIIYLQPIDDIPLFVSSFELSVSSMKLNFYEMLQGFVQIFFSGMEVSILPVAFVNSERRDWNIRSRIHEVTNQRQYCVNDLYPWLYSLMPRDGRCILGISWTDLYPEGFNFVLGEASHTHKSAVVSFGRFETKDFDADLHQDISAIDGKLIWKLFKTITHEVCHIFSFSHCTFFHCAMNESSSVQDALSQPLFLCPVCLRKLQKVCGFDILERYHQMHRYLSHINRQFGDSQHLRNAIEWLARCLYYLTSDNSTSNS